MKFTQRVELIRAPDSTFVGIGLGGNHWTEHECGIQGIKDAFGVGEITEPGIPSRLITEIPENFNGVTGPTMRLCPSVAPADRSYSGKTVLVPSEAIALCGATNRSYLERHLVRGLISEAQLYAVSEQPIIAAWSDNGFIIIGCDDESRACVRELYMAIKKKDAIIVSGVFPLARQAAPLIIAIASRIPVALANELGYADIIKASL